LLWLESFISNVIVGLGPLLIELLGFLWELFMGSVIDISSLFSMDPTL
jgi:hypothetical protein